MKLLSNFATCLVFQTLVAPFLMLAAPFLMLAAPVAAASSEPGSADVIEEIVVTSEFRRNTVDRTAASVSVLALGELRGRALNHIEDVLARVPNVNFAGGSTRARFYQIRGIGERSQQEEPINSSVGLLIDGVDFSGIGTVAVLHDVAQIEVLRGPQGTLYGANALAGLIHVRTNEPTRTFEAGVTLDVGNFDARGLGFTISGPLSETLAGRLAIRQYQDDGFHDNDYLQRSDTSNHDELSIRGRLQWAPVETLDIGLAVGYVDIANGYDAFSLDNDRHTRSDEPGQDDQESVYASLSAEWKLGEGAVFEGTLGFARSDIDYGYDEDWTYVGFHPWEYSSTDRYLRERNTTTLDLRLLSGDAGRIFNSSTDWVVGFYALKQNVDFVREYTFFPGPFSSTFDMDRVALYGELSSAIGERGRLTFGLRAERHESNYQDSQAVTFEPQDDLWGGRLVLQWDLQESLMVYGSATRGYKAGGFNPNNSLSAAQRQFDPESLWNFELGLKGRWLEDRLTGRFSLFSMQRQKVQIGTSIVEVRPDGSSEFIQLTSNAAEGTNNGFEMELAWAVNARLDLIASVGLLDTEFRDFINSAGEDLDGQDQAHAPHYQFFLGAEYRAPGGLYLSLSYEGKDSFYYSDSRRIADNPNDLEADPYQLINAAIGFQRSAWDVRLWGRNLTNEAYTVRGFYFPNDPRDGYTERGWFQLGEPRRYGLTLSLKF